MTKIVAPPTLTTTFIAAYSAAPIGLEIICCLGPHSFLTISITSSNGITAPVGTHQLKCTGLTVGATPQNFGTPQKCVSNPNSIEE